LIINHSWKILNLQLLSFFYQFAFTNAKELMIKPYNLAVLLLLFNFKLFAQNHLYTTEQFGINGAMLGGAVTAGSDDVSMTFYNPAAIHKVSSQFNVSLVQPTLRTFGFDTFWGNEENGQLNRSFGLRPDLLSFKVKVKNIDIAFIRINKSELSDIFNTKQEIIENNLTTSQFFNYEYSGRDVWFGIGSNLKLGKNLYIGLSQFMSSSRFSYRNNYLIQELDVSQSDLLTQFYNSNFEGNYNNIGFVSKLGFLLDTEKHDLGITVMTPKYARISKGGNVLSTNIDLIEGQKISDQIIDVDISPIIKTPWTFTFGYSLALTAKQKFWVNTSYHTGITEYDMSNITSLGREVSWRNGSKSVLNFSFGTSRNISTKFALSGGVRTNNFAYENKPAPEETLRNTILDGNHIHFVLGSKLRFKKNTILLGVDYGTIRDIPNVSGFQNISDADDVRSSLNNLGKSNISLLLTYRFIIDEIKRLTN